MLSTSDEVGDGGVSQWLEHMFQDGAVSGTLQGCDGGAHVPRFVRYERLLYSR